MVGKIGDEVVVADERAADLRVLVDLGAHAEASLGVVLEVVVVQGLPLLDELRLVVEAVREDADRPLVLGE